MTSVSALLRSFGYKSDQLPMKSIIILCLCIGFSFSASANFLCLKDSVEKYIDEPGENKNSIIKKGRHQLGFNSDSCGANGCRYYVFTEVFPGCKALSFERTGYLVKKSFVGNSFKFRFKKERTTYQYKHSLKRFRRRN